MPKRDDESEPAYHRRLRQEGSARSKGRRKPGERAYHGFMCADCRRPYDGPPPCPRCKATAEPPDGAA